jgi:hypothetical protein
MVPGAEETAGDETVGDEAVGAETAGDDGASGPLDSAGAGDAGALAWARRMRPVLSRSAARSFTATLKYRETLATLSSEAADAVCDKTISPIEAAIFQRIFPMPCS